MRSFDCLIACSLTVAMLPGYAAVADESSQDGDQHNSLGSGDLYFPGDEEWQTVAAADAGYDAEVLKRAVDFAMSRGSSSIVILHRGRLLAEQHKSVAAPSRRYRGTLCGVNEHGHAVEDVASCQKSVTSVLVGIAVQKGLLQLSDSVSKHLETGWSRATAEQERKITVRHLITMTSGLTDQLTWQSEPGTRWRYNSTAYSKALTVVCRAADLSANELTVHWLTGPLGMKDSKWVERNFAGRTGVDANRLGFATTARDLARFGLMMLAEGRWRNSDVLTSDRYRRQSVSTSQKLNPAYGYLWWLNGTDRVKRGNRMLRGTLIPGAPADLYAAQGALGRKCYVVPSLQLVVVRLGDQPDGDGRKRFDVEFWRRLQAAVAAEQPR